MKTINQFVANDGKVFDSSDDCVKYEYQLEFDTLVTQLESKTGLTFAGVLRQHIDYNINMLLTNLLGKIENPVAEVTTQATEPATFVQ